MQRRALYRLVVLACVGAAMIVTSLSFPATSVRAATGFYSTQACRDGFVFTLELDPLPAGETFVADVTGSNPAGSTGNIMNVTGPTTAVITRSFTGKWNTPQAPGTPVTVTWQGVSNVTGVVNITDTATVADCMVSTAQFYNPNDGRVDPHPWDRLAIWCNTSANPPTLDIWGVGNDSKGFRLLRLVFADLAKTGNLSRSTGRLGNLLITVDAQNNFTVVWRGQVSAPGGSFVADGNPDHGFAKSFRCGFAR